MDKRTLATVYRALLTASGLLGILIGVCQTDSPATLLSYYTLQSNVIVTAFFGVLLLRTVQNKPISRTCTVLKGAVTMCITVTFIVYHFMLRPQLFSMNSGYGFLSLQNLLLHYVTPLMAVGDYILLDNKGSLRWTHPFAWAVIPMLYPLYVLVFNLFGGRFTQMDGTLSRYPYFFLDVDVLGWGGVLKWIAMIFVAFMVLSYTVVGADALLGRLTKPKTVQ